MGSVGCESYHYTTGKGSSSRRTSSYASIGRSSKNDGQVLAPTYVPLTKAGSFCPTTGKKLPTTDLKEATETENVNYQENSKIGCTLKPYFMTI